MPVPCINNLFTNYIRPIDVGTGGGIWGHIAKLPQIPFKIPLCSLQSSPLLHMRGPHNIHVPNCCMFPTSMIRSKTVIFANNFIKGLAVGWVGVLPSKNLACWKICSTLIVLVNIELLIECKGNLLCQQTWLEGSLLCPPLQQFTLASALKFINA